jgi:4'-phosphopantetheinyl transferase EntD
MAGVGIDAEPHAALPGGVLEQITLADERAWIRERRETDPAVHWDRLVFSAKEAVYKTWFPLANHRLEFDDALITVDSELASFHAKLLVSGPSVDGRRLSALRGRWLIRGGLVLSAVAIERLTPR